MTIGCPDLLASNPIILNESTQYSLYSGNDVLLCAYKGKRTGQLRVVDHERLLSIVDCTSRDEGADKVTLRIIHDGIEEIIESLSISNCRTVAYNWKPSTIEFGTYHIRVSKQDLFHQVDGNNAERIVALKADIWGNDDTRRNKLRSIVKGGTVSVPKTVKFNQGTGQHQSTIIRRQNDEDTAPIFTLDYSITASRHPAETVKIRGMTTTDIYRGIGIGSAIIERFLGSFSHQTPIALIAVSEAAERFWDSVGFNVVGGGKSEMPEMDRKGTNTIAYPRLPTVLNGMYTFKYGEDQSIQLMLDESVHVRGDTCRLCTTTTPGSTDCTELLCTHYTNEERDTLEFQYGDTTEELEFNRLDLKRSSHIGIPN